MDFTCFMAYLCRVFKGLAIVTIIDIVFYRKTEVMNLLESAGFSRSNPYYVVQQGKVWTILTHHELEMYRL